MTRIETSFATLKTEGRAGLVTFVTAGDPDFETSRQDRERACRRPEPTHRNRHAVHRSDGRRAGDPGLFAPGAERRTDDEKDASARSRNSARRDDKTPIVLMGYYNPDLHLWRGALSGRREGVPGADGLIVVDLPPEHDDELCVPAMQAGLNFIRLATPTTDDKRLTKVLSNTSGFVYYVSVLGITGTKVPDVAQVISNVARIKRQTSLPVAVGFGVKSAKQAEAIAAGRRCGRGGFGAGQFVAAP